MSDVLERHVRRTYYGLTMVAFGSYGIGLLTGLLIWGIQP